MKQRGLPRRFRVPSQLAGLVLAALLTLVNVVILGVPFNPTAALWTDTQQVPSNAFSTKPDWEAPTTSAAALMNSLGYAGVLRQGDTYQVCASVSDGGAPPSGIASVTANLAVSGTVITTGLTAAPLTSGGFTCDGVAYNYRSGNATADNPLSEGSKTFNINTADNAGNSGTTPWSTTVDNSGPQAIGLQTVNVGGGTTGQAQVGDQVIFTFNESLHLPSIKSGWDGTATSLTVTLNNNVAGYGNNDTVTFDVNLGTIDLGANNYTNAPQSVFGASMVWSAASKTITITLTSLITDNTRRGSPSTATFYPVAAIQDRAGNNANTASTPTESGTRHF